MALPAALQTGTVTGHIGYTTGNDAKGIVALTQGPEWISVPSSGAVVARRRIEVELDAGGNFSVEVPATDDSDASPVGWAYKVEVILDGGGGWTGHLEVPVGGTVDLSAIVAVDPNTGVTTVRGPKGDPGPSSATTGMTFVPFGDSFVDNGGGQTYVDGATRFPTGSIMWMEWYSQGRLRPLANAGVGGNSTTAMLPRLQAEVIDRAPKVCVLLTAGVNDTKNGESPIANLASIFDRLQAAGIVCVTGTIPPTNLVDTTAKKQALFAANRWLLDQATQRSGLVVVDLYTLVADPGSVAWAPGLSADGTHPTAKGAEVIGRALAAGLGKLTASTGSRIGHAGDPFELAPNPALTGNTGGLATSTAATGGSGSASKVARTDRPGEWQRYVNTSGTVTIYQDIFAGYAAGDRVVARFEIRTESMSAVTQFVASIEAKDAGFATLASGSVILGSPGDMPSPGQIVIECNPVVVPASTTRLRPLFRITGPGTIDIGAMSVRKVNA